MIDDYKYSVGRTIVYRHSDPTGSETDYGRFGANRTIGVIREVHQGSPPDHIWIYTVENLKTGETVRVPELEIHYTTFGKKERHGRRSRADARQLAKAITDALLGTRTSSHFGTSVYELMLREESEARAKQEGSALPIQKGDYIRVRGDLRPDLESYHNHYAKVMESEEPDIAGIETRNGVYKVIRKYRVLLDDGSERDIYDPEIKLYYTADGRKTILNWRAAMFLSEAFMEEPPYSLEYSYLENHVFTREELETMPPEGLASLLAALLYVKGRIGLRDFQQKGRHLDGIPREHLVDSILAISRFDMRKNRYLTPREIEDEKKDTFKLRRLLKGK